MTSDGRTVVTSAVKERGAEIKGLGLAMAPATRVLVVLALAGWMTASASATAVGTTRTIYGDSSVGGFKPYQDFGRLSQAIAVFGEPASLRPSADKSGARTCSANWKQIGLLLTFNAYRGGCIPESSCVYEALVTGRNWQTSMGLRIGDLRQRLYTLYPHTRAKGAWRSLLTRTGIAGLPFTAVAAKLVGKRVVAFRVVTASCEGFQG